ncbi:hypothetical protein [Saccharibacillus sp. JS10]|uniref:hypothetical protein n=1 Tax=Saccharibacillus sp. JS10 TaxID=2950552 RepID=UPI00210DE6D2|nr:hypothetical protein [Saccharibacillus sp. JS10]MCQ4088717.1 hypothetical protein [Saccharibacillus sp. JS10]
MFTFMILITGMLSSLSTQDLAPSYATSAIHAPIAVHQDSVENKQQVQSTIYPANSGLETLNGITLQDRIRDVDALYGKPLEKRPAYMGGDEYLYGDLVVGAYQNWIDYVSVPASLEFFNLNGRDLPMDAKEIRKQLGRPDFVADDGFGYEHDGQAIKIFTDSQGEVRSVDLFDNSSV